MYHNIHINVFKADKAKSLARWARQKPFPSSVRKAPISSQLTQVEAIIKVDKAVEIKLQYNYHLVLFNCLSYLTLL